ncbi:MAG TPA: hypothetical protein VJU87_01310 [Gemmatimonadaceae bacterium]|nr:hypothetical protein [Gemmatimonadaceae bacterium]
MNGNFLPVIALAAMERDRRTRQRVIEQSLPVALGGPMAPAFAALTAAEQQRSDENEQARRDEQIAREAVATVTTLASKPPGQTLTNAELTAAAPQLASVLDRIQLKSVVLGTKVGTGTLSVSRPIAGASGGTNGATAPAPTDATAGLLQAIAPYIVQAVIDRYTGHSVAATPAVAPLAGAVRDATEELSRAVIATVQEQVSQSLGGIGVAAEAAVDDYGARPIDPNALRFLASFLDSVNAAPPTPPTPPAGGGQQPPDAHAEIPTVAKADQTSAHNDSAVLGKDAQLQKPPLRGKQQSAG